MPTVILLDTSLSMSRPVSMSDTSEEHQRLDLAMQGIQTFTDYLAEHCKLEFVELIAFSSEWYIQVPFTRNMETIRNKLSQPLDELGDKTCIESTLSGVSAHILDQFGIHNPIQILLITDGSTGIGEGSLKQSLKNLSGHRFPIPFQFLCSLHIMCIAPPAEATLQAALPLYQKLISLNEGRGEVFIPEGQLHTRTIQGMFKKCAEKYYNPFHGSLKCGNLKCNIQLFPPPDVYERDHDFERVEKSISRVMEVCGFFDISDVASPPYISRHFVLPTNTSTEKSESRADGVKEEEEDGDGKMAAFTVLLHGSLKVENMIALTQLADDWFGIIYSYADNKKKSNLMLSVFKPGTSHIPWLGNLNHLAPLEDFDLPPYGEDDTKTPFPIRPSERRSYAQNCVVWLKQTGIQADIQKILRNARKLPEKQQHFYKELNRLRKAALAYGFHDLMDAVAQLLERECTMLPGNAHPDAALQLTHAANSLKNEKNRDQNVVPLSTNFTGD